MPKKTERGTLWDFSTSVLSENSKKMKRGPFEGKKNRKKVAQCRKKLKESHSEEKIARKSFWLKQGLEPVTAGFTINRVLTSTRERE